MKTQSDLAIERIQKSIKKASQAFADMRSGKVWYSQEYKSDGIITTIITVKHIRED